MVRNESNLSTSHSKRICYIASRVSENLFKLGQQKSYSHSFETNAYRFLLLNIFCLDLIVKKQRTHLRKLTVCGSTLIESIFFVI